jgi:hypothetical protein
MKKIEKIGKKNEKMGKKKERKISLKILLKLRNKFTVKKEMKKFNIHESNKIT